jgi:hypothetical protein
VSTPQFIDGEVVMITETFTEKGFRFLPQHFLGQIFTVEHYNPKGYTQEEGYKIFSKKYGNWWVFPYMIRKLTPLEELL